MEDFINFMNENFPTWIASFMWVNNPGWQSVQSLPQEVKVKLINEFSGKDAGKLKTSPEDFYNTSIGYLKLPNVYRWETVKRKTFQLEKERNLDISVMLPDLQKVINDF